MTEISFYFNVPDKAAYACRLLRKALNAGNKAVVTGEPAVLDLLDVALWTFSPLDFMGHCFEDASTGMVAAAPVLLLRGPQIGSHVLHRSILLNLGLQVPDGFEQFERLIELVSTDDADRQLARTRWKHYAHRGYALIQHDVNSV